MSTKDEVIKCLEQLADLTALAGENKYKSEAYRKAAYNLKQIGIDPAIEDVRNIDGIGDGIYSKIQEIVNTGTCEKLENLKKNHAHLLNLMEIPGIGPKTAIKIYNEHGVTDAKGVQQLVLNGVKFNSTIISGIDIALKKEKRISYQEAEKIVRDIEIKLKAEKIYNKVCGSFRRHKEDIGDLDFVVKISEEEKDKVGNLLDEIIVFGKNKISGYKNGVQVDFRISNDENFGSMMLYFTGSRDFNIRMRKNAIEQGMKLNEYGLWKDNERVCGEKEEEIFSKLNMEYVNPEERK